MELRKTYRIVCRKSLGLHYSPLSLADDQVTSRDVVNCRAGMYIERRKQYGTLPKSAFKTIHILREIRISTHKKEDFLMFCD